MSMKGSVCSPENRRWLEIARAKLAVIKEKKLLARHEKQNRERHHGVMTPNAVYKHIVEELVELKSAVLIYAYEDSLEEIADLINCAEILAAILIKEKMTS